MKAKFIGDPNDDGSGPKVLRMAYGPTGAPTYVYFPRDQFVGVPQQLEAKMAGMGGHFEIEDGDAPLYEPSAAEAAVRVPRAAGGDAKAAGKPEVLARLEAMKAEHPDLVFDPKWSVAKLRNALDEAEFEFGED